MIPSWDLCKAVAAEVILVLDAEGGAADSAGSTRKQRRLLRADRALWALGKTPSYSPQEGTIDRAIELIFRPLSNSLAVGIHTFSLKYDIL